MVAGDPYTFRDSAGGSCVHSKIATFKSWSQVNHPMKLVRSQNLLLRGERVRRGENVLRETFHALMDALHLRVSGVSAFEWGSTGEKVEWGEVPLTFHSPASSPNIAG